MRRRLDDDLNDCTHRPHHYVGAIDGEVAIDAPPMALHDEQLWDELQDVRARLRDVERRVIAACVAEPLDEVETRIGLRLNAMLTPGSGVRYDDDEWDRLEEELREHAAKVTRKEQP